MSWLTLRTLYKVVKEDFEVVLGTGGVPTVAIDSTTGLAIRVDAVTGDTLFYRTIDSGTTWTETAALPTVEQDSGMPVSVLMDFVNTPTTGDTATIGADVYEFRAAAEDISNNAYIGVFLGVSAAACLVNWVAAINGAGTGIADGILAVGGGGPLLVEDGTELIVANVAGTDLRIRTAAAVGGAVIGANPSIVLAEAITHANNIWNVGNVNLNTLGGIAAGARPMAVTNFAVTAAMITNTFRLDPNFTVTDYEVFVTTSAGVPRWNGVGATTDAVAISNNGLLFTFGGGAADADIQATDIVYVKAWGAPL